MPRHVAVSLELSNVKRKASETNPATSKSTLRGGFMNHPNDTSTLVATVSQTKEDDYEAPVLLVDVSLNPS